MWRYYCSIGFQKCLFLCNSVEFLQHFDDDHLIKIVGFRILIFSLRIFCFVYTEKYSTQSWPKIRQATSLKKVPTSIKSLKWTQKRSWAPKSWHFTSTINRGKTLYPRKVYWNWLKGLSTSHIMVKTSLNKNFTFPKTLVWCIVCFTNFTGNSISLRFPRSSCQYLQYYNIVNVTSGLFKSELPLSHIMSGISLKQFRPVLFHTFWKNQKGLGFLVFFGGRKLGHWTEIGYGTFSLQARNPLPAMHLMIKFFMDKIHSPYKLRWLRNPNCWLHSLQDDKRKLRNNAAQ